LFEDSFLTIQRRRQLVLVVDNVCQQAGRRHSFGNGTSKHRRNNNWRGGSIFLALAAGVFWALGFNHFETGGNVFQLLAFFFADFVLIAIVAEQIFCTSVMSIRRVSRGKSAGNSLRPVFFLVEVAVDSISAAVASVVTAASLSAGIASAILRLR
jgi:hypothetical protein